MKILFNLVLLLASVSGFGGILEDLPEPYRNIEELLHFDGHGWYDNGRQIEQLISSHQVKTIIEVGSWLGASTRHMAQLLPAEGKVYAIDHWLGSEEHQPGQLGWYKALPRLYEQFLSNVIHAGLTDKIVPIRLSSLEASEQLKGKVVPDLIYIDAAHDTESVYADLVAWYPYVQGHGILCGDDWTWTSIQTAVQRFAQEKGLTINASGLFWRLVEP